MKWTSRLKKRELFWLILVLVWVDFSKQPQHSLPPVHFAQIISQTIRETCSKSKTVNCSAVSKLNAISGQQKEMCVWQHSIRGFLTQQNTRVWNFSLCCLALCCQLRGLVMFFPEWPCPLRCCGCRKQLHFSDIFHICLKLFWFNSWIKVGVVGGTKLASANVQSVLYSLSFFCFLFFVFK